MIHVRSVCQFNFLVGLFEIVRSHIVVVADMLKVCAVIELRSDLRDPRNQPSRTGATQHCNYKGCQKCRQLETSLDFNAAALEPIQTFFTASDSYQWECLLDGERVFVVSLANTDGCC